MRTAPNAICGKCTHYKPCINGYVTGIGYDKPDCQYVFVFPYPEEEDDNGAPFTGKRSLSVIEQIEKHIKPGDKYYVTYLVKCITYENDVSRRGKKDPSPEHINFCLKHFQREMQNFPNAKIMGFGKLVFETLTQTKDSKFMKEIGSKKQVTIGGRQVDMTVNIDPGMVFRQASFGSTMETVIRKFLSLQTDTENSPDTESKYKILDFKDSMRAMDEVIDLHKSGKLDWTLFDIENSVSLNPWEGGEILMYSFAHTLTEQAFLVPLYVTNEVHWDDLMFDIPKVEFGINDTQRAKLHMRCGQLLEQVPISGHNLKYDVKWCGWKKVCNIEKVKIHSDTNNSAFQILNKGPGISLTLKDLSRKYFNVQDSWEDEVWDYLGRFRLVKDRHFGKLPTGLLGRYSGLDGYWNTKLEVHFDSVLNPQEKNLLKMMNAAIVPFADTEIKGMHFDPSMHEFLKTSYTEYLETRSEKIYDLPVVKKYMSPYLSDLMAKNANKKKPKGLNELKKDALNLNGPKAPIVAFDKNLYGLPVSDFYKTEKGAPQFNKDAREWLFENALSVDSLVNLEKKDKVKHKLFLEAKEYVTSYAEYKRISKLLNDYVDAMPESVFEGLYRPSFNLNGTTTGRLSSPFHSMPNRCDIKRLIDSRWKSEGGLILAADYSQLELRIVAALSNEIKLIDAFKKGYDIHTFTASEIFKVDIKAVTEEQRQVGKTSNFAMLYGKTAQNLAADLGITIHAAEKILKQFYSSMNNLTAWMKVMQNEVKGTGYVVTQFGRKIPVHSAFSKSFFDIAETERLAVNYPVQSSASDLVFSSVNDIWYRKQKEKAKSIFLATVHDSIEHDIYPGEIFKMAQVIREEGVDSAPQKHPWLTCPLDLSMEFGLSWGGCLKGEVSELDHQSLKFTAKGLRKDFNLFLATARKAYNADIKIKEEKPLAPSSFKDDIFFRDNMHWKAEVHLSSK